MTNKKGIEFAEALQKCFDTGSQMHAQLSDIATDIVSSGNDYPIEIYELLNKWNTSVESIKETLVHAN